MRWIYILQTIFVHLPMYFHPNGNEMNSLLEGVSGFSCTNMQCLFIKVEIHSGLEGNVFGLMKFWKRICLAGQILGFANTMHFLIPSHYLFSLTVCTFGYGILRPNIKFLGFPKNFLYPSLYH